MVKQQTVTSAAPRLHRLEPKDLIYVYDGSYEGFLCCVFTAFRDHTLPREILPAAEEQPTFFPIQEIATVPTLADRVFTAMKTKLGPGIVGQSLQAFLSGQQDKELIELEYLRYAFALGKDALNHVGSAPVADLNRLVYNLTHEAELYYGFLRFEEREGWLGAVIEPKNYLLPLLRAHFCARFPEETFFIYDRTHNSVLFYKDHKAELLALARPFDLPPAQEQERYYQALWRELYRTSEIPQRRNLACRRNHCPKRYWACMTEMHP